MSDFWNERFAAEDYLYGTEPNAFLAAQAHLLRPGMRALVPADGEGRNGVWLAGRGLEVVSVDISSAGLAKGARLAESRGVRVERIEADLCRWSWPRGAFDLCVSIFAHFDRQTRASMHARMIDALRPGGLILMEVFSSDQLNHASGGPKQLDLLYRAGELAADFAALEILHLAEGLVHLNEGRLHQGVGATVRLLARRPRVA